MRSALVGRPYWVFIWRLALRLLGVWACAFSVGAMRASNWLVTGRSQTGTVGV